MFNTRNPGRIELLAYTTLIIGALGDWITTTIGLTNGLVEGNQIASTLMRAGLWIPADLLVVAVCILIPFIVNRLVKTRAANIFYAFPLLAGILKVGVSIWNMNLLLG